MQQPIDHKPNYLQINFSCLGSIYSGSKLPEVKYSIQSILRSTIAGDEIILVIDGPISNTLSSYVASIQAIPNIHVIDLKLNHGLGIALSVGLSRCSSKYILRFDTDDINIIDRLTEIRQIFATKPEVDIVGSSVIEFIPSSSSYVLSRTKSPPSDDRSVKLYMNFVNPINHPSVAFKKESILSVGSYENMPFFEDYLLWLKSRKAGLIFYNIQRPLVYMRRDAFSARRFGLRYATHELTFMNFALRKGYINPPIYLLFFVRLFMRTHRLLTSLSQLFVGIRSKNIYILNPDMHV